MSRIMEFVLSKSPEKTPKCCQAMQYPVRTLEGKEYLCTRSNIDVNCVRLGKWNWHSTRSTTDDYDYSSVIKYFDRLNEGALLADVMRAVESSHAKKTIFR